MRGHRSVEGRGVAQRQSRAGHTRIAQRLVSGALGASKRNKDSGERIGLC